MENSELKTRISCEVKENKRQTKIFVLYVWPEKYNDFLMHLNDMEIVSFKEKKKKVGLVYCKK